MPRKPKLPDPRWDFGEVVYLKIDDEIAGVVTGYTFRPQSEIIYIVAHDDGETERYECELTEVRTFGVTTEDE